MAIKKFFAAIAAVCSIFVLNACRSTSPLPIAPEPTQANPPPVQEKLEPPIVPPSENPPANTQAVEGLYVATFFTSKTNSEKILTAGFEFFADKTARLLIFKNGNKTPSIFHGKWLIAQDGVIILYFKNGFPNSEFFKKRADGNLSILQSNRTEYRDDRYDYMVAEKIQ
ncbi:MAG: hypothetical protein P1P63_01930 [Treponemataceae bacterium]